MIDTIFYFASGQSEYDSNVQALQINERTISFVPKTDYRGNIYKNNIRYGGVDVNLDYDAIKTVINNWFNSDDPDKPTIPSSGDGGDTPGGGGGNTDPIVPDWVDDRLDELEDKAQHEKERIQEYIDNKDLDIRNLIELMFDDYNEMIQNYLETGNSDFQKYTFGDEDTMEWISQLGHVTDNGDGTYSVDWSSILQKVSEINASVNRIKGALNDQGTEDPDDDTIDYEVLSSKIFAFLGEDYATNGLSSVWARLVNGKLPVEGEQFDPETAMLLEWMAADVKTWADSQQAYSDVMAAAREYKENGKDVLQEAAAGVHALVEKQPDGTYKATSVLSAMVDDGIQTELASLQLDALDDEAIAALYAHIDEKIDENTGSTGMAALEERVTVAEGKIDDLEADVTTATNLLAAKADTSYIDGKIADVNNNISAASTLAQEAKTTFTSWRDDNNNGFARFKAETNSSLASTASLQQTLRDDIDSLEAKVDSLEDIQAEAGVVTASTINGWIENGAIKWNGESSAALKSKISNVEAGVEVSVKKESADSDYIESGVKLYGDQIELTSNNKLSISAKNQIDISTTALNAILQDATIEFANLNLGTNKIPFSNLNITGANINSTLGTGDISFSKLNVTSSDIVGKIGTGALSFDKVSVTGALLLSKIGSASISADKIDISGLSDNTTLINALNSNLTVKKLTAGGVTADSTGVKVINPDTNKIAASLLSTGAGSIANGQITWTADGTISGFGDQFKTKLEDELVLKKLTVTNGSSVISINPTDGIKQTISGTTKNQIALDGSGSFANGNISWNTSGTTTIKGTFTTGDSGYQWKMKPGSVYASIDLSNGTSTPVSISGSNSNGGWLKLYNPSDDSYVYLYGTSLRFATDDSAVDDGISISYSKSIDQTNVHFGRKSGPNSSWWGTDSYMWVTTKYNDDIAVRTVVNSSGATVVVNDSSGINTISSTGQSASSDIRLKDVIANKELAAEQIADAPIFTYTPKANPNANPILGTSAQYWQDVLPEAVSEINGYLALDYTKVATTSVINLAKEVVTLKSENTSLRERVEALEARLQLIENKLNAQ